MVFDGEPPWTPHEILEAIIDSITIEIDGCVKEAVLMRGEESVGYETSDCTNVLFVVLT